MSCWSLSWPREAPRLYTNRQDAVFSARSLSRRNGMPAGYYDCMRAINGLPHRLCAPPISSPCSSAIHLFAGRKRALCHSNPRQTFPACAIVDPTEDRQTIYDRQWRSKKTPPPAPCPTRRAPCRRPSRTPPSSTPSTTPGAAPSPS